MQNCALPDIETGETDCKGNLAVGGNFRQSRVTGSSGYDSPSTPIRSSWIQRLIPAQISVVDEPHLTKALPSKAERLDGLQADFNHDGIFKSDGRNQSVTAIFKNCRRSRQVVSSRHELFLSKTAASAEDIDKFPPEMSGACIHLDAVQPRIQVPPRTLPVVESLLNSENAFVTEVSMETDKLHHLLEGSKLPIKQTVNFSANEGSVMSCSFIERFQKHFARFSAVNLKAQLETDKWSIASSQVKEFSFNHPPLRSNMESKVTQPQTCTYFDTNLTDARQASEDNCSQSRNPVSCRGLPSVGTSFGVVQNTFMHECMRPCCRMKGIPGQVHTSNATEVKSFHLDQKLVQMLSKRSHQDWEYNKGTEIAFEVFCGERRGGFSSSELGNHGSQHFSNLVSSQLDANSREKTSVSLGPGVVKQTLCTSQEYRKDINVLSESFSFHLKGISYGSVNAMEKGHRPISKISPYFYIEYSDQTEVPMDLKTKGSVETSRLGIPVNAMQQKVDNVHESKTHYSPFFRTDSVMDYEKHGLTIDENVSSYKPKSVLSKDSYMEELNQKGGIMASRLSSVSRTEGAKSRDDPCSFSSATMNGINWEGIKPYFKGNSLSVGSIESTSKRPSVFGNQDLFNNHDTVNAFTIVDEPTTLPSACHEKHPRTSRVGNNLKRDLDRSLVRKQMWLNRWSTRRHQKEHFILSSKGIQGFVNSRCIAGTNHSSLQSSWDSSHCFDLQPAKRACYRRGFGLRSEPRQAIPILGAMPNGVEKRQAIGFTSHFLKRFLTPSAAALPLLGMTAKNAHALRPRRKGLFAVWPAISSNNRPFRGRVDPTEEFSTRQENKKETLRSSVKRSSDQVHA